MESSMESSMTRQGSLRLVFCLLPIAIAASLGCASLLGSPQGGASGAVVDARFRGERLHLPLDTLVKRAELAPGQDFNATLLGSDPHQSHHLVAIRSAETPHRHDEHDLLIIVIEGHGSMLIGQESQPVGAGSIVYIPRRTRHAFSNESPTPATAYAVYTPPFDGEDRVADE